MTQPEGQTARDIFPEDEGIPEVSQDDSPTQERAEDPQFAPLPGERPTATVDFGTTAARAGRGRVARRPAGPRAPGRRARTCAPPRTRTAPSPSSSRTSTTAGTTPAPTARPTTSRPPPTRRVGGEGPEESADARHRRLTRSCGVTRRTADRLPAPSAGRVGASAIGCLRL